MPYRRILLDACQYRAARAMLGWTLEELAERSGVSVSTLRRIEAHPGVPPLSTDVFQKVVTAFADARIRFIADDGSPGGGPGLLYNYPGRGPDTVVPVKQPPTGPVIE